MRALSLLLIGFISSQAQVPRGLGKINHFLGSHDRSASAPSVTLTYATLLGGSSNDHATAVVTDRDGKFYVSGYTSSFDFPVTQGAAQGSYKGYGQTAHAFAAKFDPDGGLIFATYVGGSADDRALAIAVDAAGSAYVVGRTFSPDFPTTPGAIVSTLAPGGNRSAGFVTKLSPAGDAIVYSTLLGSGTSNDTCTAIAVDREGDAVVAGSNSSSGFTVIPANGFDPRPVGSFVAKLNATGTGYLYVTASADSADRPKALTLDTSGNAYITGSTSGSAMRSESGAQPGNASHVLFRTSDAGGHWSLPGAGLTGLAILDVAVDQNNDSVVYASTSGGLFQSQDGGDTWITLFPGAPVFKAVIDPSDSQHVVIFGQGREFVTRDRGANWNLKGFVQFNAMVFDPSQPQNAYAGGASSPFYSRDGGDTWTTAEHLSGVSFTTPTLDPSDSKVMYSASSGYLSVGVFKSVDAGVHWTQVSQTPFTRLISNPKLSNVLYGIAYGQLRVSGDGGISWAVGESGLLDLFVNPYDPAFLYLQSEDGGLIKMIQSSGDPAPAQAPSLPANPTVMALSFSPTGKGWAVSTPGTDAFVTRVTAGGEISFSTYFGGSGTDSATGITLDGEGNIVVAGTTNSADSNGSQSLLTGGTDIFVTKLSSDGSRILASKMMGGNGFDFSTGMFVESSGNITIVGTTGSLDFPLASDSLSTGPVSMGPNVGFILRLDANWSITSSSYFGGTLVLRFIKR